MFAWTVVFVLGTTGSGKSKLAIDLATHLGGEVVNSDKMQVYDGLDIITNKVTEEECAGIPHHLIGGIHPDSDFSASDFSREASKAVDSILARGRLPIVAGGSNSYIEELVDGQDGKFRSKYRCCFVWIDVVDLSVLDWFVSVRVDAMVEMGLVEEAREFYRPDGHYSRGIRRSIGVPEMDQYFRSSDGGEEAKAGLLKRAIDEIKENTRQLARSQLLKIRRLSTRPGWDVHRVDATEAARRRGQPDFADVWNRVAKEPSIRIVDEFLNGSVDRLDTAIINTIGNIAAAPTDHAHVPNNNNNNNTRSILDGTCNDISSACQCPCRQ